MTMKTKCFLSVAVVALIAAGILPRIGIAADSAAKTYIVYLGTYTRVASKGIYGYRFTPSTGELVSLGLIQQANNPSWLAESPNLRFLYAVNEHASKTDPGNTVTAYAMDRTTGKLTFLNKVSSKGKGPAHLSIDKDGKILAAANFGSGSVATFLIHPDGSLGEAAGFVEHHGTAEGPQIAPDENGLSPTDPHNHCAMISPDGRFLLVCNIGLGKIFVYRLNRTTGALEQYGEPFSHPEIGWRPRHLAFHPNGKYVSMISSSMEVTTAAYDAAKGTLKEIQTVPISEGASGPSGGSEIQVDRAGRFVYTSSRGVGATLSASHTEGTINVLSVDAGTGKLTPVQHVSSLGDTPRNFALDPSGKYMFVGNEYGGNIAVFSVDPKNGMLTPTGKLLTDVKEVSCILFVEQQ